MIHGTVSAVPGSKAVLRLVKNAWIMENIFLRTPSNPIRSASLALSCTFKTYKWTTTVYRSAFRPFKFTVLGGRMETAAGRAQLIYNKSCLHANLPPRLPFACLSCVPSTALGALRKNPSGSVQKASTVNPPRIWSIWPQHKRTPHCGASWSGRHGLRAPTWLQGRTRWTDCSNLQAAKFLLKVWHGLSSARHFFNFSTHPVPMSRSQLASLYTAASKACINHQVSVKNQTYTLEDCYLPELSRAVARASRGFARSSGSCCWQASA